MQVLPIYIYNNPVLRKICNPVSENSDLVQLLIDQMFHTMYEAQGIGLAAPQVGSSQRLFVADIDVMSEDQEDEKKYGPMVFINPVIADVGEELLEIEEGCLSLPGLRDSVKRPVEVTVDYLDRNFVKQSLKAGGWMSRVIQHELDHLDGVLFIDRMGSFRKRLLNRKLDLIDQGLAEADYPVVVKQA